VNVFRDQGKRGTGDGKELCDVLVVFGDSVVLFSDKSCGFPDTDNEQLDWERWYRRCVKASRRQLDGAERWIRQFPNRLFLDRRCTVPLPVTLPPADRMRVYKVAVALGAEAHCQKYWGDPTGGFSHVLPIIPTQNAPGDREDPPSAFTIPLIQADGRIIHVVDGVTLPIMLLELDTAPDFIEYLKMKEQLINSRQLAFVEGEENLVGLFLGVRARLSDMLNASETNCVGVTKGIYADIVQRGDYRGYVEQNKVSYFWDFLIANHALCVVEGTLFEGSPVTVMENEAILRMLAVEPRVRRRMLAKAFLQLIDKNPRKGISSRSVRLAGDTMYVFQISPFSRDVQSRKQRQEFLLQYCFLTAWRNQDVKRIVGICTEGTDPRTDGYDVAFTEVDEWTSDLLAMGADLNREMSKDVIKPLSSKRIIAKFPRGWGTGSDKSRRMEKGHS
jgi:hypothetical protein